MEPERQLDPDTVALGTAMRALRESRGITQSEVAAATKTMRQPHLARFEKGEAWPSTRNLRALCRALRCRVVIDADGVRVEAVTTLI